MQPLNAYIRINVQCCCWLILLFCMLILVIWDMAMQVRKGEFENDTKFLPIIFLCALLSIILLSFLSIAYQRDDER